MFGLSKTALYAMAAFVVVSILIAAGAAIRSDLMTVGKLEANETARKDNDDAGNVAEKHRAALRDCIDRGGVYVFETGACER